MRDIWNTLGLIPQESRKKAQELFRDIHSITVIPIYYKDKVEALIQNYKNSTEKEEKIQALNQILDYTFSIPAYMSKDNMLERIKGLETFNLHWLKAPYDEENGLAELRKDPELSSDMV